MTHGTTDPLARRLDESLRETLLDLERLRQREARALRETTALRDVLSAITRRSTPQGALHGLLDSVCQTFGADAAAILLCQPGRDWTVAHATGPAMVDAAAPVGLSGQGEAALLCLSKRPAAFTPACLQLLCRIADIAGGTLDKLALADRQALLAAVIEGSTASITIADAVHPEVPLIYVNPAFEALTGYGRTEVLARNCRLLAADPPDAPERQRLRQAVADRQRGRFLLFNRRKDGSSFRNELDLDPVPGPGKAAQYLVATQMDVTEREETRADLQRLDDRLAAIAAVSDIWFWEFDRDLRYTFVSDSVERTLGLRPADILGQRLPDLALHPAYVDRGDWPSVIQKVLSLEPILGFAFRAPATASRDAVIQVNGRPFFDPDGRFAGYRGIGSDVTDIIRTREEAELASRAKSEFLATMSHELRTPLTGILGNVELLMPMVAPGQAHDLIAGVAQAGRRLDTLLRDAIDLARLDAGRVSLCPVRFVPAELVENAAALHRRAAEDKGLSLRLEVLGTPDRARAHACPPSRSRPTPCPIRSRPISPPDSTAAWASPLPARGC